MLFEIGCILAAGLPALSGWCAHKNGERRENEFLEGIRIAYTPALSSAKSPVAELVVELLKSDEGWTKRRILDSHYLYIHEKTGVRVSCKPKYLYLYVDNTVVTELATKDKEVIRAELQAYDARAADCKQREIARVLAERVLGGQSAPVLGDDRVSNAEDDSVAGFDPVSPGLLTFDPGSGKVVQLGAKDSGVQLDESLRERYGLSVGPGQYGVLMSKLKHNCYSSQDQYEECISAGCSSLDAETLAYSQSMTLHRMPPSGDD